MTDLLGNYKLVLGLEIHIHVNTKQKMFCGCDANIYDAEPNTHTCPTCLGLPGALPVPNYEAVKKTQLLGLATDCQLNTNSKFDRKHYFYPDLSKGYQISQYKEPLCEHGKIVLSSGRIAEIERIHLEEDTAKSKHENGKTLIDFNKGGMPLMELVTTPCFSNIDDAVEFAKMVRDLARYLNISEADMEKGQMRIEPNISLRTAEMERLDELPPYKVEIKNINSFRFMEKAVKCEIVRQRGILETGLTPEQQNRGYDENKNVTVAQRSKEEAHDYRYFPEPDIPPMIFSEQYIEDLKKQLPELPAELAVRLATKYQLKETQIFELIKSENKGLVQKLEELASHNLDPVKVANLLLNKLEYRNLSTEAFIQQYNKDNETMDDADMLTQAVKKILAANTEIVDQYKNGKESVLNFLLGQVMRETKGKANPEITMQLIKELI